MNELLIERLKRIGETPDEEVQLTEAALLLATEEYPTLNIPDYLSRLDELADTLMRRLHADISVADKILALNRFLFKEQRFAPNTENYYDPRNSFLNEVMDRRIGIPITLSIIYMDIGKKIGLPLHGVAFPGHFLVKCAVRGGTVVLDAYSGGASLDLEDLQQRFKQVNQGEVPSKSEIANMLTASPNKDILVRMLRNLKSIYLHFKQHNYALTVIQRILLLKPDLINELKDRAEIYIRLECFRSALTDLEQYLELEPDAEDFDEIRTRIMELQPLAAKLN